ncbi:MAG: sugar-binding domain-containing protein [Parabacteroides merdae]
MKLRFDGVSCESVVYLNGKEIGSHMGGMTAFELDVTKGLEGGVRTCWPCGFAASRWQTC